MPKKLRPLSNRKPRSFTEADKDEPRSFIEANGCCPRCGWQGDSRPRTLYFTLVTQYPMETISELNSRDRNWKNRHKRAGIQRSGAFLTLKSQCPIHQRGFSFAHRDTLEPPYEDELVVHLVRISPMPLDSDNLQGAMKATRDGVADWIGLDDRDPRIIWIYSQERGVHKRNKPKEEAVRIEMKFWKLGQESPD